MRTIGWASLALACALGLARGQDAPAPAAQDPAAQDPAAQDPAARLEATADRFGKARDAFFKAYRAAKDDAARAEAEKLDPDVKVYVAEFVSIARDAELSDTAAEAWIWVGRLAGGERELAALHREALETLTHDFLASAAALELPMLLNQGRDTLGRDAVTLLREVVANAPRGPMKAGGMYQLADALADDAKPESEGFKEAHRILQDLQANYADVKDTRDRSYGDLAAGQLFVMDRLQVGQVVPDIEGNDLSGVAFKLSDYRGKVVLLDFWGNW